MRLADRLLPLFFVSSGQINVQLPDDVAPGTYTVIVSADGMPDVKATFLNVPPPGLARKVLGGAIPGLAAHDADLQPLRNQLAQSWWVPANGSSAS